MANLAFLILVGIAVGAAAGYIGSFMVVRRMALVGDALTHVALPGIAIALTWHFAPMLGAFLALGLAAVGVWYLEQKTEIYPEALVGIFFTASLAIGILITPKPELLEALFGNIAKVSFQEGTAAIIISFLVIIVATAISEKLILGVISKELAKSAGVNIRIVDLAYLLLVATVVALGVKFVGTMLMGALVVIPAVAAKNISRSLKGYGVYSAVFGIASAVFGIIVATLLRFDSGPIVVLAGVIIFLLTLLAKKPEKLC